MTPSSGKGNDPEKWELLLQTLDEKLQLGLLDRLRRVSSYHFEDDSLIIQPSNQEDYDYLNKPAFSQQLTLIAQDITKVEKVVVEECKKE